MLKKKHKIIALLLAVALLTTGIATNNSFARVWAEEQTQETVEENEKVAEATDQKTEDTENVSGTQASDKVKEDTGSEDDVKEEVNKDEPEQSAPEENNTGEQPVEDEQKTVQNDEIAVQANGVTTVGELKAFMNTAFDDATFREAVLTGVLEYYGLNDSAADTDVITNTKKSENRGPDNFASPEEVLGWVGKTKINVSNPDNLEGVQYISKLAYAVRTNQRAQIDVHDKSSVNMQTFWGKSNNVNVNPNATITTTIQIDQNTVPWKQSDNSSMYGKNITLPHFLGDLNMGNDWVTVCDNLTYLRTGNQNKKLIIKSQLLRENGDYTTKEGILREEFQNMNLMKITDTAWIYQPIGKMMDAEGNEQYYDEWEYYRAGKNNTYKKSPSYRYEVTAKYYSSINVDLNNQVYGGFTFSKISENDNNLNLSGAQYVVMKNGEYLSDVGGNNKEAEFTNDITKAKVFETDKAGTFEVSPIPEGDYKVIEVKAPEGYKLNTTPVSVTVVADKTGIATSYDGAEGNSLTVNADETTLTPHWDQGNYNEMTVSGDTTTETLSDNGLFIRNASEGGKNITQMRYELINNDDKKYTTLQEPEFTIKDLNDDVVKDSLNSLDDVKNYINESIIGKDVMQSEWDSYKVSSTKDLIYYDTTSAAKCVATQTDEPLPVNLKFDATKTLIGGDALTGGEFEFRLEPDAGNPNDDPFQGGMTVTNKADGTIEFGQAHFTKGGTYKYTLKETDGGTLGKQDDITYDTAERSIEIEVKETGTDGLTATVKITSDGKTVEKTFTSVDLNEVSYPHLAGDKIQNDQISQTTVAKEETIDVTEFTNSKGLMLEKTSQEDTKKVTTGDTITYKIVVKNPNPNNDQTTKVYDSISAQLELLKCTIDGKETDWTDGKEVTVPKATKDANGNIEFGQTVIALTCKVKAEYNEKDMEQNIILNQAYMEKDGKKTYTKTISNALIPPAEYKMTKTRITPAPQKGENKKEYGFAVGTKNVYYEQTIENTGKLDLSMKVGDAFSDELDADGKAASDNFENLKIMKVVIIDKAGKSETYEADQADVFTGFGTENGELKKLPAGATAVITYSADIKTDATENLDSKEFNKKDKDGSEDKTAGYLNTASTSEVKTSYEKPDHITIKNAAGEVIFEADVDETGNLTVTTNEDKTATVGGEKPEITSSTKDITLKDAEDTDRTPVQVPKVSYTMEKGRITNADPNGNTKTYGFVRGDKVQYKVLIKNTGELPLTMDVSDSFADAEKFEDLKVEKVEGATENEDLAGSVGKNITIEAGKTAVLTFSAVVATDNVNLDDAENRDWSKADNEGAKGYLNTAKTEKVSAKYTYKDVNGKEQDIIYTEDGNNGTVAYPKDVNGKSELENKEDVANTPVRPVPGYKISKIRMDAPEKENVQGKYGFRRGETVTYTVRVENTGTMDLTMNVEDKFTDNSYFTDLKYTKVEGAAWNNNTNANAEATSEVPNITVKAGETAVITITAKVADITPEKLSDKAEYFDGANGYQNTVTAKIESGTYTYIDENGVEQQVTVKPEDYPEELKDKSAECTTPVQVRETGNDNTRNDNNKNKKSVSSGSKLFGGPKTGDSANWTIYIAVALLSLMAVVVILVRRRRNR